MRLATTLIVMLLATGSWATPTPAEANSLTLELNKVTDSPQGCLATLLIGNKLERNLDRFRLDLVLFNGKGVLFDRVLIDLAPLPRGRTTVASFPLVPGTCTGVSRILLQDVPACRAEGQKEMDCLSGIAVSSRTGIEFGM
ncbi:MAG: hypothetical protein VCE74_13720 [Alphaproteobacteria bacterium]